MDRLLAQKASRPATLFAVKGSQHWPVKAHPARRRWPRAWGCLFPTKQRERQAQAQMHANLCLEAQKMEICHHTPLLTHPT